MAVTIAVAMAVSVAPTVARAGTESARSERCARAEGGRALQERAAVEAAIEPVPAVLRSIP